jgi:hypothetical protein
MTTKNREKTENEKPSDMGLHPFFNDMKPKANEPNWDGVHVCLDCEGGISKLTAESFEGRCVTCFDEIYRARQQKDIPMIQESEFSIPALMRKSVIRSTFKHLQPVYGEAIRNILRGRYDLIIKIYDKFTIAELVVPFDNYQHHYFGLSVKNPKDDINLFKATGLAFREALTSLCMNISIREMKSYGKEIKGENKSSHKIPTFVNFSPKELFREIFEN